jgi:CBS domain-containing protein
MKHELVRDWMTTDVITINPSTTLPEAHQIMKAQQIRRLPIVDKSRHLVGIVTIGDIRGAGASSATSLSIWEMNYLLAKLKVKEVMTANPITVSAEATIGEAAQIMLQYKVGGLPVVEASGKLAGIITESDIFEMIVLHEWQQDTQVVPGS